MVLVLFPPLLAAYPPCGGVRQRPCNTYNRMVYVTIVSLKTIFHSNTHHRFRSRALTGECRNEGEFCSLARKNGFYEGEYPLRYSTGIKIIFDAASGQKTHCGDISQPTPLSWELQVPPSSCGHWMYWQTRAKTLFFQQGQTCCADTTFSRLWWSGTYISGPCRP